MSKRQPKQPDVRAQVRVLDQRTKDAESMLYWMMDVYLKQLNDAEKLRLWVLAETRARATGRGEIQAAERMEKFAAGLKPFTQPATVAKFKAARAKLRRAR